MKCIETGSIEFIVERLTIGSQVLRNVIGVDVDVALQVAGWARTTDDVAIRVTISVALQQVLLRE